MQAAIRNDYTPQECLISYFKSAATIVISKRPNYEQYKYALECPLTSKKKLIFNWHRGEQDVVTYAAYEVSSVHYHRY